MEATTNTDEMNGIKFTWNMLPNNKPDANKLIVPIGFHYTPVKKVENLQLLEYDPLRCSSCKAVINPHFPRNYKAKYWECAFCKTKNNFPTEYANFISETNLPIELLAESSTVEYKLNKKESGWPIFLFLIDTAVEAGELVELKESIQSVISNLPQDCQIGIITYGNMCHVHEIGFTEFPICYSFKGEKDYKTLEIQEYLGLVTNRNPNVNNQVSYSSSNKFIAPLNTCELFVNTLLDELQPDPWGQKSGERFGRCGGLALHVAVSLLEAVGHSDPSRVFLFCGGESTIGSGQIVGKRLVETIRNYTDFEKGNPNTKYYKAAVEFYNNLAMRASKNGIIIDVFACSLNQVGLYEMRNCVEKTGGYCVMTDSFSTMLFKDSFRNMFTLDEMGNLQMNFKSKLLLHTTNPVKVSGAIGYLVSMEAKASNVSEVKEGEGGTNMWALGGMDSNSTYTFILDFPNNNTTTNKYAVIQVLTQYIAGDRTHRLRVSTTVKEVQLNLNNDNAFDVIGKSFDQEAACVMIARMCVLKGYTEETREILKWVDKSLIRLISKFAKYQKDNVNSFKLSPHFNYFPQFMFYLRRSHFIQNFNASPDEMTYYKTALFHENVVNSTIMIQPILFTYTPEKPDASPVFLDIDSMKNDHVLLLDAFFFVSIWHGEEVKRWRDAGYHNDPEYENIKLMLESPVEYAQSIIAERIPIPRFITCDSGQPQERYFKATVNPSPGGSSKNKLVDEGFMSDDVSLKVFMDYLIKISVTS
jgi:protein transport protein SEC23